jgi:signal transduction histidine kinase
MPTARRALARLCWDGIAESTEQYWRLQQTKAAGTVRDLERALATLNEFDRARAEAWREAAHDLKGSVTVVKGAASVLEIEDVPEPVRLQFFERLQRGVASLHEMLNDLMSLARLEAGHEQRVVTAFDAGVLLADFCTVSQPLAHERDLQLNMQGPDTLPVEGDRTKIQRLLQNLLLNAIKYTQHGGVTVIWGACKDSDPSHWMFCVQDTGPGLDPGSAAPMARQLQDATQVAHSVEHVAGPPRLRQAPTLTAHSTTLSADEMPGEGVGLSIVERLCELLDASLEFSTRPGEGSTFRVILPRSYPASAE